MYIVKKYLFLKCVWFNRFINNLIICGQKSKIENVLYHVLFFFKIKYRILPIVLFYETLEKLRTPFALIPFRKGASIYFLPFILTKKKQYKNSIFWLAKSIKTAHFLGVSLTETIIIKLDEIIFLDNSEIISSNDVDLVGIEEERVEKDDKVLSGVSIPSAVDLFIQNNREDYLGFEYNTALDYKLNIYKSATKNRTYFHYRWK